MKFDFGSMDGIKSFQLFLDAVLFKLADDKTKESALILTVLRELYANKVMPKLIKDEPLKSKITLSKIELIALDIVLSEYDLLEIDNTYTATLLNSLYSEIDRYLINHTKHYPSCSTQQLLNTGEYSLSIKS